MSRFGVGCRRCASAASYSLRSAIGSSVARRRTATPDAAMFGVAA